MRKILRKFYIIQISKTGIRKRLNPYNPLSYLLISGILIVGIIAFGIIGFWSEIDLKNPFKWQ